MLIIGKKVKYAAKNGTANTALVPSDLDAGAIGIYGLDKDGLRDVLITNAVTATGKVAVASFKGKTVKICEGLGNGAFKVSEFLDCKGISVFTSSPYKAPVAWKAYIGYNGTANGIVLGQFGTVRNELAIKIEQRFTNGEYGYPQFYDVLLDATGETQQTIATKIKTALDLVGFFTVVVANSGANYGVSITSKVTGKDYRISMQGPIQDTKVTYVGYELGTLDYLKKVEAYSQARRGDMYTSEVDYKKIPSSIDNAALYETYAIGAINTNISGGFGGAGLAGNPSTETSVEVIVAFDSTEDNDDLVNGGQKDFEVVMSALSGITVGTQVVDATP